MREIKFRGYAKELKKWIFGDLIENNEHNFFIAYKGTINKVTSRNNNLNLRMKFNSNNNYINMVEKQSIGQYTGLKDINEKEIYEGDILSGKIYTKINGKTKKIEDNWVIDYYNGAYWLNSIKTRDNYNDKIEINIGNLIYGLNKKFKIIGNIYENSDLLKI